MKVPDSLRTSQSNGWRRTWRSRASWGVTIAACLWAIYVLVAPSGCASAPKQLFTPLETPACWPAPPDVPHIFYVGQLSTDRDLKPGKNGAQAVGEFFFGKNEPHAMTTPYAVATHDGRLYVADSNAHVVHMMDTVNRKYEQWQSLAPAPALSQPVGIAYDPAGRILVSDAGAGLIFAFDMTGHCAAQFGAGKFGRPCGIAVDPETRRIFVADAPAHQVVVLDAAGNVLQRLGERGSALGQFNYPTNVALDHHGRLYVSDSLNFRIQQFDHDLKPVRQIGSKGDLPGYFAQPKGIAIDSEDHLYVIDSQFESVQIFDDQGRLLMDFGEEGQGPGQFWLPAGLTIDPQNRIWIADAYNHRVQAFDYRAEKMP